jgi:hypothetical protein
MRVLLFIAVTALATAHTFAQGVNTAIIKERAREVSGTKQPPLPTAQQPATAAKAQPAVNPAQQAMISRLSADIAVIKIRPEATAEQRQKLTQDLLACAPASARPAEDAVRKIADSLAVAVAGKKVSAQDQGQLARNLAALMGAAPLTPEQTAATLALTRDALLNSGASQEHALAVVQSLQTLKGGESTVKAAK